MTDLAIILVVTAAGLRLWLEWRQRKCLVEQQSGSAPSWAERGAFARAVEGAILRGQIAVAGVCAETAAMLVLAAWGLSSLAQLKAVQSMTPVAKSLLLAIIVVLMIGCVRRFVDAANAYLVDASLGLGRPSIGVFLSDTAAKMLAGSLVTLPVLILAALLLENNLPEWWLYAWIAWFLLVVLDMAARPLVMTRLLYRAIPLRDDMLARRIGALLHHCELKLGRVRILDASRRTRRANASVHGLGRTKHILLHDTLLDHLGEDEVLAVVAHEAGHAQKRHLLQHLIRFGLLGLGASFALAMVIDGDPRATSERLGLMVLILSPAAFLARPLILGQSRRFEYEADEFAARYFGAIPMMRALQGLHKANAGGWTVDSLYAMFHASHPSARERLTRLQDIERDEMARHIKTLRVAD